MKRLATRFSGLVLATLGCLVLPTNVPDLDARQAESLRLTMEEAITLAVRNSPAMAQRDGAIRTAEAGERTAFGAFIPNVSFGSGHSRSTSQRFDPTIGTTISGSSTNYNAGLSASLDIFTAGRRGAQLDRARSQTESAEAALVEQRYNVILGTKQTFFNVLRGEELARLSEGRIRRAEEGLQAAERHAEVGSGTRSDILRARLEVANARQAFAQAEHQRITATYALGRLVGVDGPVGAQLAEVLEPRPLRLTREELLALATQESPSIQASQATVRSSELSLRAARTAYAPSLRLSGGYDWSTREIFSVPGNHGGSLRLNLSYPIFNGWQREQSIEQADVQRHVAQVQLRDARRAAVADIERMLAALTLSEQQIELARESVEVAGEDLRVQQERYRLGVSTILDQITSQLNLAQAEMNLVSATYDYQLARAELEAVVGRDL